MDVFGAMRGSEAMLAVVKEECTVRLPDEFDEGGGVMLLALVLLFSSIIATDKYAEDIGSTRTMFVAETKWNWIPETLSIAIGNNETCYHVAIGFHIQRRDIKSYKSR